MPACMVRPSLLLFVLNRLRRAPTIQQQDPELAGQRNWSWQIAGCVVASLIVQLPDNGHGFPVRSKRFHEVRFSPTFTSDVMRNSPSKTDTRSSAASKSRTF